MEQQPPSPPDLPRAGLPGPDWGADGSRPMPPLSSLKNRLGRLGRLVRKELSEILRDRRTILTLVLMPILVYPLIAVAFQQYILASSMTLSQQREYILGFVAEADYGLFVDQLKLGDRVLAEQDAHSQKEPPVVKFGIFKDLKQEIKEAKIHLGIVGKSDRVGQDRAVQFRVIYQSNSEAAREILEHIERRLAAANGHYLKERLGIPDLKPASYVRLERLPIPVTAIKGVSLAALIPLILILMTITGAVYPAIDLTAGERERGTLEILVAAPVPRLGLLFAKYVTVLTVAVLTALVNLLTMLVTLLASGLGARLPELSVLLIMQLLGLLLLFAAFFSAVLLIFTSFARSFKEAQAYLIPLMLLSLAPGVLGMLPDLKLEGILSVAPLVNIVLLSRDLFDGKANAAVATVVVVSTLMYAVAAIATAARIFGSEGVLYNEQSGWSDLWRRPAEPRQVPSVPAALGCLALMFPSGFILHGVLPQPDPARITISEVLYHLAWMAVVSVLLFAGFPLISAFFSRVRLASGFRLHIASLPAYLGGALLGLSLWPLVLRLLAWLRPELPMLDQPQWQEFLRTLGDVRDTYPLAMTLAFVVPALVEELFFRGYLFSALRGRTGAGTTIVASALLFGFFHVILSGMFLFERLLPSTLLGLVLGWVAWRSGSVLPGMILHGSYNAMLILVGQGEVAPLEEIPLPWIFRGLAGTLLGLVVLQLCAKRSRTPTRSASEGTVGDQ